jgi:hypothetical protein
MGDFDYSRNVSSSNKSRPYADYASMTITTSGAVTDYSLKQNSTFFNHISSAYEIMIKEGDSDFTFKLNSVEHDMINYREGSTFGLTGYPVGDIFITTSGAVSFESFALGWR